MNSGVRRRTPKRCLVFISSWGIALISVGIFTVGDGDSVYGCIGCFGAEAVGLGIPSIDRQVLTLQVIEGIALSDVFLEVLQIDTLLCDGIGRHTGRQGSQTA
jgi:hypothetical protein